MADTNDQTASDSQTTDNIQSSDQTQQDAETKDISKQTDSEFMQSAIDAIKNAQTKAATEENVGTEQAGSSPDVLEHLAGTDIPDAFSAAAEAYGMSPDEIVKFADGHTDEELIELIPYLTAKEEINEDDQKGQPQPDKTKQDDKTPNAELEAQIIERITKQLEEKFNASLQDIEQFKASQKEQSNQRMVETASRLFDEAAKDYPVFGKTDELPVFPSGRLAGQLIPTSPAVKARLEVLRHADAFMAQGARIEDAMKYALATYKGLHLEKDVERKVVKDLKSHEQKLSGARVGMETKKKYADTREEIIDEIKQMQRQSGIS